MGRKLDEKMRRNLVVFLCLIVCFVCAQSAPVRVTFKQQQDGLKSLNNALKSTPAALKDGKQFKAVLTKWIQDTDEKVLRALVDQMQNCHQKATSRKFSARKPSTRKTLLARKKNYGSYEDRIPPRMILKRLHRMAGQTSGEQLKTFTASMKTPEGQNVLSKMSIKQSTIDEIQKEMNGDAKSQLKARNTFKALLNSIPRKDLAKLRDVYKVYLAFDLRQQASNALKKSTPEQLTRILQILTRAEKRYAFSGITFSKLLEQVKTSTGRAQAVETINKWLSTADIKNLRRVVQYTRIVHKPTMPLHQVKILIGRKIDRKSHLQLTIFLEVLETAQGKALLNKLSVKPSVSSQSLLKQLKVKSKKAEKNVKKVLKQWIHKLTLKDMKELQSSRDIFSEHYIRRVTTEAINKADQATMLQLLTYLSMKESSGVKLEGIKFSDLKVKLEKDGSKSLAEVKKLTLEWINKAKAGQLAPLRNVPLGKPRRTARKGANKKPENSPSKQIKNTNKISVKTTTKSPAVKKTAAKKKSETITTINSLADIKTAAHFHQFAFKQNSKLTLTSGNVKKALILLSGKSSSTDMKTIFAAAAKGLNGYRVRRLQHGLFKVQTVKANSRVSKANSDWKWKGLKTNVAKWIGKWKHDQTGLFLTWYRRGAGKN